MVAIWQFNNQNPRDTQVKLHHNHDPRERLMSKAENTEATVSNTEAVELQNASDENLFAAECHEEAARCHRAAAESLRQHDSAGALESAAQAHLRCNDAFMATIAAHKLTAGDHC